MKLLKKRIFIVICFFVLGFSLTAEKIKPFKIAVFVPGVVKGSPTYEMLYNGVKDAAKKAESKKIPVEVKLVEAGYNQGEWKKMLTATALTKKYDLIVSSNPSLPSIVLEVLKIVPNQKFLLLDANLAGNKNIKTIAFNQYEQGLINGYFAALISTSDMKHSNKEFKLGLLAGQEFPVMNNEIKKGFLDGAKRVNKNFELDFRVLGNWFDAGKASEMTKMMLKQGADVILTICGGGNAGVVSASRELGGYVMWFDSPGYSYGKNIVGSSVLRLNQVCAESTLKAILKELDYGTPTVLGIKENAVDFAFDGIPDIVPDEIIKKQKLFIESIKKN